MTFDERVELAAMRIGELEFGVVFAPHPDCLIEAREILLAAMPDLYGEKPTHEIREIEPAYGSYDVWRDRVG